MSKTNLELLTKSLILLLCQVTLLSVWWSAIPNHVSGQFKNFETFHWLDWILSRADSNDIGRSWVSPGFTGHPDQISTIHHPLSFDFVESFVKVFFESFECSQVFKDSPVTLIKYPQSIILWASVESCILWRQRNRTWAITFQTGEGIWSRDLVCPALIVGATNVNLVSDKLA